MLSSAEFFKDETLQGISRSIKQLHQMQAEAEAQKLENFGITKQNPHFKSLLHHIDMGLSLGLNEPKHGYWPLVKKVCHKSTIQMVQSHHEAADEIKRGHIWLYLTFMESSLPSYIKLLRTNEKSLRTFYRKYALLRDTERCMIFEQLLVGLEMVIFVLDFNSPLSSFSREPLFKPHEFYAAKRNSKGTEQSSAVPVGAQPLQVSSGTQTPPDVTISDETDSVNARSTPDLLRQATNAQHSGSSAVHAHRNPYDDDIVTHLRSRKRGDSAKRKPKVRLESEDSVSGTFSNELEDDNYIPEFQDSFPIKVIVPDKPREFSSNGNNGEFLDEVEDEDVYEKFLLGLDIQTENKEENDKHAYRITYVSNEDFDDNVDHLRQSRNKERSLSLDSFDRFCRSGSTNKDDRDKSRGAYDEDDEDDDEFVRRELDRPSPPADAVTDDSFHTARSLELSSDAIGTSPMSEQLPKDSVDKVLTARYDTTAGILLPTLPRRPNFADSCGMYRDLSIDKNVLVLLSLEIFEKSTEAFRKIFQVYVGYLFGIRKQLTLLITNINIYLLTPTEAKDSGFSKELSIPIDSVNRIQSGVNMQDVLITHDEGKLQLWTGNEIITKNIILALSSSLTAQNARTVSVEQMKVDFHRNLDLKIKDWLLYIENVEESELLHFALVDFHSISSQTADVKVLKSGLLQRKTSYLGVVPHWEASIFGLRGPSLYEYYSKGNHELKQVFDLRNKCGGCVRTKPSEKVHGFKVLSTDGSTPLLELAASSEEDANDWIVNICQVVADSKHGLDSQVRPFIEGVAPRALALSATKLYIFIENSRTKRLQLIDSCTIQDIPQICVDNEDRSFCAVQIDDSIDSYVETSKRTWVLKFHSEYELGKFEQKIFAVWHTLYQVPLQFVLLADNDFKRSISVCLATAKHSTVSSIDDSAASVAALAEF
ncbi:uncharacterized protein LOC135688540 isoform X2 [Rhopilema esculentum]|uniref:uncharacterized protein LOC135688540 isoform X2 n=1 Tax=Rhopilema esculentum TaxID=499914 RepID=UPI0031D9379E